MTSESSTVKTFTFKDKQCAKAEPGQFVMLWIPGVDEIPLSVLDTEKDGTVSIIVKNIGEATNALHKMKVGDFIGMRGPFGNSFTTRGKRIVMVGGGTGTTPLLFLAKRITPKAEKLRFIIGAKTKEELLLVKKLEILCGEENVIATTEDGSYGIKCLATAPLETLLSKENFDVIYTCGPERMMRKVLEISEKHSIPLEASLERLMLCAIGLCGSCVIGKYRVCIDGPVFTGDQLKKVRDEFGILKRDFDGRKIAI